MKVTKNAIKECELDVNIERVNQEELGKEIANNLDGVQQSYIINSCIKEMGAWSTIDMEIQLLSIAENLDDDAKNAIKELVEFFEGDN